MTELNRGVRQFLNGESVSFVIPSDWEVWDTLDDVLFLASAPEDSTEAFEAQVVLVKEDVSEATTSSGYLIGNLVYLKHHMTGFCDHASGAFDVKGGQAAWLIYSSEVQGLNVTTVDFYVVVGRTAYLIQAKSPSDSFAKWKDMFEAIGRSIEVSQ